MRTIIRIARVELSNLFFSPIAWLLMIIFFIQVALAYLGKVEDYVTRHEAGGFISNVTYEIFADPQRGGYSSAPSLIACIYISH